MILSRALINETIILFSNQDPESALWETSWVHFRMEDADPNPVGKNPGKFAEKELKTLIKNLIKKILKFKIRFFKIKST